MSTVLLVSHQRVPELREKIYNVYVKNHLKIEKAQAKQPSMEWN